MARHRRNSSWCLLPRRISACVALACYLATAIGFPLANWPHKDQSQPFPCQDHPCGCQTAEQCWRHCCCFSPEERLAWAADHHIEPPSYMERSTAHGWHTARLRDRAEACEGSSRADCGVRETCQACSTATRRSCCADRRDLAQCCSKGPDRPIPGYRPKPLARIPWMLGVANQRCRGITTLWVSVGAVLPPPIPPAWSDSLAPAGWLSHENGSPLALRLTPPDPPPRISCA